MAGSALASPLTEVAPDADVQGDERVSVSPAVPYDVVLWNDPVTLMDVVVRALGKVFGYGRERAEHLMMTAHHEGKVAVWTGEKERAVRYCLELGTHGLQATVARS